MQEEQKNVEQPQEVSVGTNVLSEVSEEIVPTEVSTEVLDILPSTEVEGEEQKI